MKALLDTNILIDHLNGITAARKEIGLYPEPSVSVVTWMEVLAGARGDAEDRAVRGFLGRFRMLPLTSDVAERAVALLRAGRLRLPDAIIRATAETHGLLLVTRNTMDFSASDPGVRVPYRV